MAAAYFNSHSKRGSPQVRLKDFVLFDDVWTEREEDPFARFADERYSDLDREIFGKLR